MVLVLVTGCSGYIALHVAKLAADAGHTVRGTVRCKKNAEKCDPVLAAVPSIELVEADLLDDKGWAEAVKGCQFVFHIASPFPIKAPANENDLIRPAVDGTLRVLKACAQESSVKRVVLTSSTAAVSAGHSKTATLEATQDSGNNKLWTENDWSRVEGCEAYAKSKTLAEQEAWKFINEDQPKGRNLELVTINPGFVLGPALTKAPGSSTGVISRFLKGDLPMVPEIHMVCVDVRDVAKAHILGIQKPVAGRRFLLVNKGMWMRDIGQILADKFKPDGYSPPTAVAPHWLLWILSFFDKDIATVVNRIGSVTLVDNTASKEVLGVQYTDIKQTLEDMGESLIAQGYVPEKRKP